MRRCVMCIIMFALMGAVVNVAVTWGCALWSEQESWSVDRPIDVPEVWPQYLHEIGWPAPNAAWEHRGQGTGVTILEFSGGDAAATWRDSGPVTDKMWVSLEVRKFGVPFRSMQWETHGVRAGQRGMDIVRIAAEAAGTRSGIDLSEAIGARREGRRRALPLTIRLPAFIANIVIYAMLLWLLFAGPGTLRRAMRRRRGQCEKCAYPIGASPVCTECGAAVRPRPTPAGEPAVSVDSLAGHGDNAHASDRLRPE